MARWLADDTHRFLEWETDLSSQTGASQAGIPGSNENIPAFRWVEKEIGRIMACPRPTIAPSSSGANAGTGSSATAARAAATSSPAKPTT